jgi:hypothetical protein
MNFFDRHWLLLQIFSVSLGSTGLHASESLLTRDTAHMSAFSCIEKLAPDQLVVSGGAGAQSVNPAEAGAQVDQRMLRIKNYVSSQRGSVVLLDRLRGARDPGSERGQNGAALLPFMQIQRFEAILPARSNVDVVLENLFKLGMDQYGKNVRIDDYSSRNFSLLTRFRFSDLRAKLLTMMMRCRNEKAQAICALAKPCVANITYAHLSARYLTEEGQRDFSVAFNSDQLKLSATTALPEPSSEAAIEFEFSGSLSVQGTAKR